MNYKLLSFIGAGNQSEGYLGYDLVNKQKCIIKVHIKQSHYTIIFREFIILDELCRSKDINNQNNYNDEEKQKLDKLIKYVENNEVTFEKAMKYKREKDKYNKIIKAIQASDFSIEQIAAYNNSKYKKINNKRRLYEDEDENIEENEQILKSIREDHSLKEIIREEEILIENYDPNHIHDEYEEPYFDEVLENYGTTSLVKRSYYLYNEDIYYYIYKREMKRRRLSGESFSLTASISDYISSFTSNIYERFAMKRNSNSLRHLEYSSENNQLQLNYNNNIEEEKEEENNSRSLKEYTKLPKEELYALFQPEKYNNYIIRLYDIYKNKTELPNIVFEYVNNSDGEYDNKMQLSPEELQKKNFVSLESLYPTFTIEEVKFYFRQLFHAIKVIHDHKVMHRDINSPNIVINPVKRYLKIIDFHASSYYVPNVVYPFHGGRHRHPPELLFKTKNRGFPIDVWAAGIELFRCITQNFHYFHTKDNQNLPLLEKIASVI